MNAVCVFCGSSPGGDPAFAEAARAMGKALALRERTLVYGGGNVGLMGILADAALAAGGTVVGVIPRALVARELAHNGLSELHVVESMHERKAKMAELADGFVALPGGIGTLEEFFEIWTWGQLGLHDKPYGLLNVAGFYDPLLAFLSGVVEHKFIRPKHREMLLVHSDPDALLRQMDAHHTEHLPKWIGSADT